MSEIWKSIKGFENLYEVSNLGNVRSLDRVVSHERFGTYKRKGNLLKQAFDKGYLFVRLYNETENKIIRTHRLVAETFITNPEKKRTVNHINGIKSDNRVCNLEWNTYSENLKHSFRILNRKVSKTGLGRSGILHPRSKAVIQFDLNMNLIAEFNGILEASRNTGIKRTTIGGCCNGDYKTAGGYKWRFK